MLRIKKSFKLFTISSEKLLNDNSGKFIAVIITEATNVIVGKANRNIMFFLVQKNICIPIKTQEKTAIHIHCKTYKYSICIPLLSAL